MKKTLLAGGASAVLSVSSAMAADPIIYDPMPAPVEAHNPFSGHIEAYFGGARFTIDGDSVDDAWIFGGAGRANYAITERWNVQGDLFGESMRFDLGNLDQIGAAAHVYWRDPNRFALGIFGSAVSVGSAGSFSEYVVGPEAQAYFGNFTLYGQAYFGKLDIGIGPGESSADVWGARGVARYFLHDDFKIEGEVGYKELSADEGGLEFWTLAAQADYRFSGTPFSVFGRYEYETADFGPVDQGIHKGLVGFRATFGAETLKAEDRYGATMDQPTTNIPLPFIGSPE